MSELDRSKFKGGTLNSIKDEQSRAEAVIPNNNFSGRAGFHSIEDGKNWFRIAPSHNANEPAYRAQSKTNLECEVQEVDESGRETGKKEVKRKGIFIATQHSTTLTEDPILLYIQFVQQKANDEIQDKTERSKFLQPVNGWRDKDGKWNWGIKPTLDYVCYAWNKQGELGRLSLYQSILDDMKKESVIKAEDNMEIIPDIFTDPDEGRPLLIVKGKNDKTKKNEYSVYSEELKKGENWAEYYIRNGLTDAQLIEFMNKESLAELYKDVYTMRDFNFAIDGLQRFDKQYKYQIFENEEFIERITKLKKLVPEYKSKDEKEVEEIFDKKDSNTSKSETKVNTQPTTKTSSEAISVPVPTMKRVLKEYIADNYGDPYTLPELSKEDLVKWYNLSQEGEELPFAEKENPITETADYNTETKNQEEVKQEQDTEEIDPDIQKQIDALRKRRKG